MATMKSHPDKRFGLDNLKGCIFIITYGRSGSTILQSTLQSIPGSCIRGENDNLLFQIYQVSQRAAAAKASMAPYNKTSSSPWFGIADADVESFTRQMINAFVHEILTPPSNSTWIGFKEIRYHYVGEKLADFLGFLREHFPNCVFVMNSRDAEKVSASSWWADRPKASVIEMVNTLDQRFKDLSTLYPDDMFHIRYEDLTRDPACLLPLFERLGEDLNVEDVKQRLAVKLHH